MGSLDSQTLLASIQAVRDSVHKYEALLESETISDVEDIEELLEMYSEALRVLKLHYQEALAKGENLPPLDAIINPGMELDSADIVQITPKE